VEVDSVKHFVGRANRGGEYHEEMMEVLRGHLGLEAMRDGGKSRHTRDSSFDMLREGVEIFLDCLLAFHGEVEAMSLTGVVEIKFHHD
jgi:hypothetical protein